ncbi:hypothetical protein ABTX24_29320 [Nocardioides sp. NPDC127514]|uniref:hypothetical protein n=1 Tax=unclassified Nocardioides TaxID=2615069 RepID=UPI00332F3628
MTDQQLRDELHRIAEGAPTAYVPSDLFARGRRAHLRSVALVVGSIAAVVALVAGTAALAPTRDSAEVDPARARTDLAVPDTIYATPSWLAEAEEGRYTHADDLEQDLAIGVGAIAYVQPAEDSNTAVAVVIDADDGDYHPLDLPDFIGLDPYWEKGTGEGFEHRPLALSPDGRELAWAWGKGRDAGSDSRIVPGGVRIADLTTGQVTEWDLSRDASTYVSDLEWSDGGERLLWVGSQMDRWDYQSYVPGDPIAGVIDPTSASVNFYGGKFHGGNVSIWAVSDNGTIAFNGAFDSGDLQIQPPGSETAAVALPAKAAIGEPLIFDGADLYVSTEDGLAQLDGTGSTYNAPNALPLQLIGWADEGPLVTSSSSTGEVYIGQLGTSEDARVLIEFDDAGHVASTVSVAYALIDADSATVQRGKPHFLPPWVKTAAPWLIVGGLAVAIWWRRHRSSAAAERNVQPATRRVISAVAVVAIVTLLVGVVAGVMFIDPAAFTSGSNEQDDADGLVTIPSTITADTPRPSQAVIPREIRWTDDPDKAVPVSDSLAVGRATLAFTDNSLVTDDGGTVVVITEGGDYRRLTVPGVGEFWTALEEQSIELSPNGLRLAYVTEDPGLNVVDLETGEVSEHPLELNGDRITSFSWSPDSNWLVWHSNYQDQTAGRIAPDGTTEPLPPGNWANAGIGSDGAVVVRTDSGTRVWPEGAADLPGTAREGMSTWVGSGVPVDGVDDPGVRSIGLDPSLDVDLAIGRNPSVRGVDVDARSLIGVAGWIADGTPLIVTSGDDGNDLRTVFPDGGTEVIAHLDFPVTQLSIATALPADLAVMAPDPAWTRTDPLPMILLVAGATGIAGFFVWRRIRDGRRDRRAGL